MEAEHLLMEQQLQETAGELQEAERALDSRVLSHKASLQRKQSIVRTVAAEIAEDGPEAPSVMRPGSAPLGRRRESETVVMPGGALVSFDSIRRDFGSMMQVNILHKSLLHAIPSFGSTVTMNAGRSTSAPPPLDHVSLDLGSARSVAFQDEDP